MKSMTIGNSLIAASLIVSLSHSACRIAEGATPRKIFAVQSDTANSAIQGQTRSDIIDFYDVTAIDSGGASDVFSKTPLFSVFVGYEFYEGAATASQSDITDANPEDLSAITINPVNGTIYYAGFDNDLGSSGQFPFPPIPAGTKDDVGDVTGDFDLYRIDYQALLEDFETNNRPAGTVYAPQKTLISDNLLGPNPEQALEGSPIYDGVTDGVFTNLPHPRQGLPTFGDDGFGNPTINLNTVWVEGAFQKVGELTRAQLDRTSSNGGNDMFFDHHLEFINPETLVFIDAYSGDAASQPLNGDHQIRIWKRESTSQGALPAVHAFDLDLMGGAELVEFDADGPDNILDTKDDYQGGFNGTAGATNFSISETWTSTIAGELILDGDDGGSPARPFRTDVTSIALVQRDGIVGIWVAEFDEDGAGNDLGDQIAFYELDLSGPTPISTKKEIFAADGPDSTVDRFNTAEDPSIDPLTADGDVDFLYVDGHGNLIIGESGFDDPDPLNVNQNGADFDDNDSQDPANEPRVITLRIADYDSPDSGDPGTANEILPAQSAEAGIEGINDTSPWSVSIDVPVAGAIDDDNEVTDFRISAIDKATGYIYIVEQDINNTADPQDDLFDDNIEDIYVFDPATGTIVYHEVDGVDGGLFNVGRQFIFVRGDITGNGVVTYDDIVALQAAIEDPTQGGAVSSVAGQEWYDLTGDKLLDESDLIELVENILGTALGDFDLDADVDGEDFLTWQRNIGSPEALADWRMNYGLSAETISPANVTEVPEPYSSALLLFGVVFVSLLLSTRSCKA